MTLEEKIKKVQEVYEPAVGEYLKDIHGEVVVIISQRIADLPEPYVQSEVKRCYKCGQNVWVSNGILKSIPPENTLAPLCSQCFSEGEN